MDVSDFFRYKQLLSPPIKRAAYSDRTAWMMAEMSRLAYSQFELNDRELKQALEKAGFELVRTFNYQGTQAFLAKKNSTKMAVLAFRGTQVNEWADIKADIEFRFYRDKNGVKIHSGFYDAYNCIKNDVHNEVDKLKDHSLYITGHSLGGALALVAAHALNSDNLAACYTFGGPKVGNEEFGEKIKPPIYRVENAYDVVPFLPFSGLFGLLLLLPQGWLKKMLVKSGGYQHHGDERYISPDDNDVKVIENYSNLLRSIGFLLNRAKGIKCHSIDAYCEKLGKWAIKRVET